MGQRIVLLDGLHFGLERSIEWNDTGLSPGLCISGKKKHLQMTENWVAAVKEAGLKNKERLSSGLK